MLFLLLSNASLICKVDPEDINESVQVDLVLTSNYLLLIHCFYFGTIGIWGWLFQQNLLDSYKAGLYKICSFIFSCVTFLFQKQNFKTLWNFWNVKIYEVKCAVIIWVIKSVKIEFTFACFLYCNCHINSVQDSLNSQCNVNWLNIYLVVRLRQLPLILSTR